MKSKNKPVMTNLERAWVEAVKGLPCSVCGVSGPCEAHEIKQGSWFTSVALCPDCHRDSGNGIHGRKAMWNLMKMTELDALNVTVGRVFGRTRDVRLLLVDAPGKQTGNQEHGTPQVAAGENPLFGATDISRGRENAGVGCKTGRRHAPTVSELE